MFFFVRAGPCLILFAADTLVSAMCYEHPATIATGGDNLSDYFDRELKITSRFWHGGNIDLTIKIFTVFGKN